MYSVSKRATTKLRLEYSKVLRLWLLSADSDAVVAQTPYRIHVCELMVRSTIPLDRLIETLLLVMRLLTPRE